MSAWWHAALSTTAGAMYMSEPEWEQALQAADPKTVLGMENFRIEMVGSAHREREYREVLHAAKRNGSNMKRLW